MANTQLSALLSHVAHSTVSVAGMDDLATAFNIMAVAGKTVDSAPTNTTVMAVPKRKRRLCRKFPLLELPPEIRCFIYEQVLLNIVEGAEAVAFVRQSEGRAYESDLLRRQVNALLHTCRIIRRECAPIYEKLSRAVYHFRICRLEDLMLIACTATLGSLWYRSQELEDWRDLWTDALSPGPPWDKSQVTAAVCRMRAVRDIHTVAMRVQGNIRRHRWSQRKDLIQSKFWDICLGVQKRICDGAGVRKAVEDEVRSQVDVEITHDDVAEVLDMYVGTFANLSTVRRPPRVDRVARFGQRIRQACSSYQVTTKVAKSSMITRYRGWMSRRLFGELVKSEEEVV